MILNLYRLNSGIDQEEKVFFFNEDEEQELNTLCDILYRGIIRKSNYEDFWIKNIFNFINTDIEDFELIEDDIRFAELDNLLIHENNSTIETINENQSDAITDIINYSDFNTRSRNELDSLINNLKIIEPGTSKRNRFSKEKYQEVFEILQNKLNYGDLSKIALKTKVPRQNISRWYQKLQIDSNYFPNNGTKSKNRMIFTVQIEKLLSQKLEKKYIDSGLIISRNFALDIIKKKINRLVFHHILPNEYLNFKYSAQWLRGFLKRNDLTFRKLRAVKRPSYSQEDIINFQTKLENYIITYGADNVYNMDETSWKLNQVPDKTLAKVGSESVHGYIVGNLKTNFTAIATISASGKKLPLIIIAKGKSSNCTKKFINDSHEYFITYSENGWMNSDVMISYLNYLMLHHGSDNFVLVLDSYSVHKKAVDCFKEKNINFLFIPPGSTGELQPLDRKVFGVLKSKGKTKWMNHYHYSEGKSPSFADSTKFILDSWAELSEDLILSAWDFNSELFSKVVI